MAMQNLTIFPPVQVGSQRAELTGFVDTVTVVERTVGSLEVLCDASETERQAQRKTQTRNSLCSASGKDGRVHEATGGTPLTRERRQKGCTQSLYSNFGKIRIKRLDLI